MVKFGLQHPCYSFDGSGHQVFQTVKVRARFAEEHGFDSFWVMDHFFQIPLVGRPEEPMLEGWSVISALASVTRKIRLGTMVTGNIYRNPAILAKIGATVDVISGGRLFMGIGAGWFEREAGAYGIPYYTVPGRIERLEEAVQVIEGMWSENSFSFRGKYYSVNDAICFPKPVQRPHPPILIGGSGEKLTLRVVARYGQACNLFGGPKTIRRKLARLKKHCRDVGTNYDAIEKTMLGHLILARDQQEVAAMVQRDREPGMTDEQYNEMTIHGTVDQVVEKIRDYMNAGIEYLILNMDFSNEEKVLSLFALEVLPKFG